MAHQLTPNTKGLQTIGWTHQFSTCLDDACRVYGMIDVGGFSIFHCCHLPKLMNKNLTFQKILLNSLTAFLKFHFSTNSKHFNKLDRI